MAKATETRKKTPSVNVVRDARIRAAMGKAIREVRRHAEINKISLAVASKKSWSTQIVQVKNIWVPYGA